MAELEPKSSPGPPRDPLPDTGGGVEEADGGRRRSKSKKPKQDPRLITDGLLVGLKGHKQPFVSYTYALTPLMESGSHIDWKILSPEGVESQHIRLHALQPDETLESIATKYRKTYSVAVILVNTEDSLELLPQVTEGALQSKKIAFPIALISSEDGKSLREFLNRHDTGELNAKLDAKNNSHINPKPHMVGNRSPGSESTVTMKSRNKGLGYSFRRKVRRSTFINLKDEIKPLMFPVSGPVCVSEDAEKFKIVMTIFYQYEQSLQRGGQPAAGPLFLKLLKHIDEMFARDFPFYLLFAYRVQKKQNYYLCDELRPFVKTCVEKFERLEPVSIAKTLETFLLRVEDFNFMFEADNVTHSIYQLIEDACIILLNFSFSLKTHDKTHDGSMPVHRAVYYRMLWISAACKFHVQRSTGPRENRDYWRDHLTNVEDFTHLNTDIIQSIKRGVEFGRLLQLPDEVSFTSGHMAAILTAKSTIRPLYQLREFVIVLEPYVQPEEEFVLNFMTKPRECYQKTTSIGWRAVHSDPNLLAIIPEGLSYLDTILEVGRKRQWQSNAMDAEMKQWLPILLQPVDMTSSSAESQLKDFLTTKSGGVTKQYRETIKREVIIKLEENLGKLSVEQFIKLYKAFLIWPNWVVQRFLTQYRIPKEVKICSNTWNEFFVEFVGRFTDAQHHKFVLEFLRSIAQSYLDQKRSKDFLLDLLRLDVPTLFVTGPSEEDTDSTKQNDLLIESVPEEFTHFLADYIQRNSLHDVILQEIETIWKLIVDHSDFQQLILQVLQEELIPESGSLHGPLNVPMKFLLEKCVSTICSGLDSLHDLTSRLIFCWGVVGSCCQKMPLSDTLEWISVYYSVIDQLGRIYSIYQSGQDSKSILTEDSMSSDVTECTAEGVGIFFKWIAQAQQMLAAWMDKLKAKTVSYDEILLYFRRHSQINRAAVSLSADSVVVDMQYLKAMKHEFLQSFEMLNIFLLRYVAGKPENGWCSLIHILSSYGVNLPPSILLALGKYVSFPGEGPNTAKKTVCLENPVPSAISGNFCLPGELQLEITRELVAINLKKIVTAIATFLESLPDLDFLSFFFLCESEIFDKHLKLQLKKLDPKDPSPGPPPSISMLSISIDQDHEIMKGVHISQLGKAVEYTKDFILRLIVGNASYVEIVAEGSLSLRSLNIDQEFNILGQYVSFAQIDPGNTDGLNGVKAMLQLFQYTRHIQVIHSVCKQYSLQNCLEDPNLKELVSLVDVLELEENRDKLTAKDAIEKVKKVTRVLCLEAGQNPRFLDLFSAVQDSSDFHRFVVHEKQFVGKPGQDLFHQQFQLITTQLQHEEYNEAVLNHLFAAFKLITPFTDTEQDFTQLMVSVALLKPLDARRQLETVNRNINLIRLWFSRAEGDTLQGVSSELRCILKSGYYTCVFSSGSGRSSSTTEVGSVLLHYVPQSSLYQNIGEVSDMPSLPMEITWNEEVTSDFVRKLGFLDAEGSAADEIDQFLHINQTATKLLSLYSKLRELGHPNFLSSPLKTSLCCSFTKEDADELVSEASLLLSKWEKEVTHLRAEYEQLLFFSIPKLLHLYQNLMDPQPDLSAVVHDVGFLFENKPHVQLQLKEAVRELLQNKPHFQQDGDTPMHIVGVFLSALFSNLALSNNSLKRRRRASIGSTVSRSSSSGQSTHILHSCTGFSHSQLLQLIISIYGGVPESFEVYHCRSTSSEEEIRLFMNPKRATKRPFQYLILEVNKLPYRLQEALVRIHFDLKQSGTSDELDIPCVHFVETGSSLLQEMPWLLHMDYKGAQPPLDFTEASSTCKNAALHSEDFGCLQLVYGRAGDGKTHYVENQIMHCPEYKRIAVNEAFTPLSAIKKLCSITFDEPECAVFFNFTLLPPGEAVSKDEVKLYDKLIESVSWFFFDLFILGYVEDPATGQSFRFPGGMKIAVYVEVSSRVQMDTTASLNDFFEDVPALGLLGTKFMIDPNTPFVVDSDVQLVCKYLKAFKIGGLKGIDRLFKDASSSLFGNKKQGPPVKLSLDPDVSEADCRKLLNRYTPYHMKVNKATQKLFIKYMKRRCAFLDTCPAFNYNPGSTELFTNAKGVKKKNDTAQLGSTLLDTMLKEVSDFCDPLIRENWSLKPHHQLVYDFKDGGGSIGLMSLHPDQISNEEKEKFKKIGVEIPSMFELFDRKCLDKFLSRALNVPLNKEERLSPIDDSAYVLTLDFALKMLNIHERAEGGVPVIIEGETGVGKTALVDMLSKLWNYAHFNTWNMYKDRIMEFIKTQLEKLPPSSFKKHSGSVESVVAIAQSGCIKEDDLMTIAEIPLGDEDKQFYSVIREHLLNLAGDPLLSVLEVQDEGLDNRGLTVPLLVASVQYKDNPKDTARLLYKFLNCKVKSLFFKLNVHAALEPAGIIAFLQPIFEQATTLMKAYERFTTQVKVPFITLFLDEVNTSSCMGLFKEVIIDRTLDGEPIPSNVFIVGACNPHRGNSLAAHGSQETWIRATYYVRQLHPTMQCLMWDYGALGEQQERDYILAKMKISNRDTANVDLANLTELIVMSQNLMRKYALEQLKDCGLSDAQSSEYSRSCVSQRDIQRVFTFYEWLLKMYNEYKPFGNQCDYNSRAVAIALGLVYYLRLDTNHRSKYQDVLDHEMAPSQLSFSKSFKEELDWYINHIDLPRGIAKTRALKENLLSTIVCTMTHTPLIIVGSPGSSKTLSFNLTLANLKGQESKVPEFRRTDVFKSLDPQIYQCSRRTTSNEITTVFNRAINRQRSHQSIPLPVYCVVFMDEAGLPQERHESLKVLHYYLDKQEVSFVAISNHVLDAAKTNRAVSLFRPQATKDELTTLAKGCLCDTPERPPPELRKDMEIVASFCPAYEALMSKPRFARFFGLRDFINFISYLRRKRMEMLSPQLVMEALERNFNGVSREDFQYICKIFLRAVHAIPTMVNPRNILDILCSSLMDHPADTGAENEMRYKLIIDSSNDGSLVRLLFSTGVLQRGNTRVFVCSDFPGDADLQKVNTIAAIRHSVTEGHTVVLSQTDSIHESFYDLFNRRFHRIDVTMGSPRYYANISIGAHIKPCRVHPDFDCVVVVKQSEVDSIPPPFLNRFEKYLLSHELVLEATLSNVPPALASILRAALEKAGEFVNYIGGPSSLYGLQNETLSSLLMSLLPPLEYDYNTEYEDPVGETQPLDVKVKLLETVLKGLKENAGFLIPSLSRKELQADAEDVLNIIMLDSEFSGQVLRLMSTVSKTEATQIIHMATVEAFHALHFTKSITHFTHEVSANACMMVSILTQWLIRHLCKRVMQLMTSEALCMDHRKIPTSYIQAYLNHQHHFSLKELLECQANKLTDKKMCAASKLVCFMRSSTTLHQLPAQFPTPIHQLSSDAEDTSLLQELVFTKTKELVVHKMSSITTFSSINELLKSFVSSKTQRVLLVVINMEDTNKELVNHLRIMIEEAESRCASQNKLFALLLHFQTCRLASPCYPIMFLPGWDFTYLEMIGYSPRGGVLDIRDWFRQCYGSSSGPDHSIAPHLSALLREAIPAICSRISFKKQPGSTFNCDMKILERNRALEQLFFNKGVGEVLCERFNSYWTSSVMVEYLEKAALHAQQHESPNVIDNLQTNFKSLFVDFLVYMVFDMNRGMNIDVLFDPDCNRETTKLFLDILRIVPIPKLPEITMTCVANDTLSLREEKEVLFPPKFPFFSKVCAAIEKLVDQTRRDLIQNVDVLDDQTEGLLSVLQSSEQARAQTMSSMFKTLQSKLSDVSQGEDKTFLSVGVEGLLSADSLWQKYLQDFSQQKLHLEFESSGICGKVCSAAFGKLENRSPIQRLAILHVYVHIHKLNLAKVVSILRPLDQVEDAVLTLTSMIVNPSSQSLLDVEDGSDLLGCSEALSGFIINTLFNAIAAISMTLFAQGNRDLKDWEVEQVKVWFRAYRDVMSMHALKEHIYVSRSTTSEAQHSAMHALFLILRSKPLGDLETLKQGLHVFNKLFCRFFTTRFDLQGPAPRLEHIVSYTLEGLSLFLPAHLPQARRILEGLLIHFFCRYRTLYNTEDVVWFLELTNKQSKWQASYIMDQVNQFTYSEDVTSVLDLEEDGSSKELSVENIATDMPMALFKFLLRRIILSSVRKTEDPINSVLLFFNKAEAHKLITKVLCSNQDLGKAGPFIPTYYQLCDYSISPPPSAENKLMQQPLAHLYFLTVMEDLLDSNYALSGLIKTTHNISKCEHWFEGHECNCCDDQCPDGSSSGCQLVLLHIEEQAIVQVIIKETARLLDQKDSSKINALFAVLPDLNAILDDEWMGGGKIGGHGLTLVMHLLREKKSFNNFLQTLTTDYSLLSDGINCLEPFHRALPEVVPVTASVSVSKSEANFMPYQDMGTDVQLLYSKVVGCMNAIHTSHGSSAKSREREFVRLSEEYSTGDMNVTTPSGVPAAMNKLACFRMTLWLATYNEFFIKKRQSKTLAQIVAGLSKRIGSQCSQLVQCFLDPDLLNRGSFVTSMKSVSGQGPTFSLFSSTTQDHASSDLQRALVHLITAILASRPNNTNLWYLLLNAEQVTGSYIPGFMYDTPIGPDTKFYNNGVDFTEDGFYACAGAIKHVTRGTLSLHSLYSLLWANFSSFSMALLTQPDVADKLSGNIFSSGECVQERCTSRMVKLWGLMQSVLCVSEEERLLLVTDCLNRFMEQQMMRSPDLRGKISAKVDLDLYEKNWHEKIFSPAWSSLRVGFARSRSFLNMPVIRDVIKLDSRYPWTPGVKSLTNTILSSVNIGDPTDQLYPLSQFVVEYPRLRTGMELLPSILELYQWLHTELTYAVSYEQATSITLGRLSKVLTRHSMLSGIGKLKEIFNNYVQLTGCTSHMRPVTLGDDTPLLHLLSCSSDHSSDLLFTVLQDVIMFLNQFFETLLAVTKDSVVMESLFPTSSPKVPVMEFVHHYMIVARTGSCSDLLQLIHSRTLFPPAYPTEMGSDYQLSNSSLPGQLSKLIDLLPLQDDILTLSVVGMPLIDPVSIASLRMPFKFKEDCSSLHHLKLQDYAVDLEEIATKLPEHFKRPLDDTYKKRLEYEFHSAGCHTVLEIVAGLRTAMGHLVKSVSGGEELQEEVTRLPFQKLPAYLVSLYEYDPQDSTTDVFHEIGINSLSQAQRGCLDSLSLDNLFHARKLFVSWAEDGFYDFCSLPFGVKKLMSVPDEDFLMHLPDNFQGSPADLLKKLRSLVDILVHLESSIVKAASTTPQKAIVRFLKKLIVCNNMDALQDMIPETVKLENYVTLRLALRRLTTQVQATVSRSALVTPEPKEEKWNDFIQDFWEDRLPHFRRRGYVYASSSTHPYFSNSVETPESSSKILDELIGSSSETNLLKEFSEEDLNVESSTTAAGPPLTDNEPVVEETCVTLPPEKPAISDEELQTIAKDVSVQQVVGFLQSVELDQYATTFEESDINGELLVQFQDEELKEMEITSALDRLKVVVFFKRFLLKSRNLTSDVLSPEGVSKILNDNRQLRHYAKTFLEKGVDGELLMSANDEVMRELGVEKGAHRLMIRNKFNVLVK